MTIQAALRRFCDSRSGVAMTEFALALPLLLTAGLWGTETAYLSMVHMRVSQLAMHVADNGSRVGDTSTLRTGRFTRATSTICYSGPISRAGTRSTSSTTGG